MKYIKTLSTVLLSVSALCSSCQESLSGGEEPHPKGSPVVIETTVANPENTTRINSTDSKTGFEQGDIVAISSGADFLNYELRDKSWDPVGDILMWEQETMKFYGYHPVTGSTSMTSFALPTDQSSLSAISNAEYLLTKTESLRKGSPVALRFMRQVARVIVNINFDGEHQGDTAIESLHISSPSSGVIDSLPVPGVTPLLSFHKREAGNRFYALVLPMPNAVPDEVFVKMVTTGGRSFSLTGIPSMRAGKSYTYNITARGDGSAQLEIGSVTIADWEGQESITGAERYYAVKMGDVLGYYMPGEMVKIKAPFVEKKKFSKWELVDAVSIAGFDAAQATARFVMPNANVALRVNYLDAHYKLEIQKPATITDSGHQPVDSALLYETPTSYVRYYATGDKAHVSALTKSPETGTDFEFWAEAKGFNSNFIYILNEFGGGQKSNTWFPADRFDFVDLRATYKAPLPEPYWSEETTKKGWLQANFIERENTNPGSITIPGDAKLHRPYTSKEKAAIMRALNAVEETFAIPPRRKLQIVFAVIDLGLVSVAGGTEPTTAMYLYPYDSPKSTWLKSDFGGRAEGVRAISTKMEAVWRDQLNIAPEDGTAMSNKFIGRCDGRVLFNHSHIKDWYQEESEAGIKPAQLDLETVTLHEVGHIICYHSLNKSAGKAHGMMALDVFVANKYDKTKCIVNENMVAEDGGDAIIDNELVTRYYGRELEVVSTTQGWDFGHLNTIPGVGVGSQYSAGGSFRRKFADFELAFLQEMGWEINPAAWKNPPGLPN